MGKRSRILLFILLNIIVSAATTLAVLWMWERAHPRPEVRTTASESASSPDEVIIDAAPDLDQSTGEFSDQDITIDIRTIVGAGDLAVEYVEIINRGDNPADLTAWQLRDETGNEFTFPALILNSGGAIKVLSKTGTNTVIELYWQADVPIWQSGETARLLNAAGELIASYSIP
ncbi:MAG: lamin tail domain-containing protein [Brevefilum sp.]|nr:lamin tail domain-containing protein [Brevefilum sp.]